jgi:catechol 2,3-dioxygenase-like lactoylglutathione lyase family enzyme
MFTYVMLGASDLPRALRFYDPLMAILEQPRCFTDPVLVGWGSREAPHARLYVGTPYDGKSVTHGNGTMLALRATSRAAVRQAHAAALANGGADEGAPGLRPQYHAHFYGAYVRDPDGNKLAFVCDLPMPASGDPDTAEDDA